MGYANRGGPRTKGPHDQCHGDRCLHRQAHRPIWWHGGPVLHRRLRAVGDPAQRLSEDGLRILRAYRFMDAGPHRMVPDEGLRHALATHADMLDRISKERIWTEFRRILSGIDPSGTLHRMQVDGALGHVSAGMHLGRGRAHAPRRWAFGCAPSTDGPDMAHPGRSSEIGAEGPHVVQCTACCPTSTAEGHRDVTSIESR